MSSFRQDVERRSALVLVFLSRLPRVVPALAILGLVAAGLAAPPAVGAVVLLFAAAVLGWLAYLSWPRIPPPGRAIRVAVVVLVIGYAISRFAA